MTPFWAHSDDDGGEACSRPASDDGDGEPGRYADVGEPRRYLKRGGEADDGRVCASEFYVPYLFSLKM